MRLKYKAHSTTSFVLLRVLITYWHMQLTAARARATLGEISLALEKVFGRYQAQTKTLSGVYSAEMKQQQSFEEMQRLTAEFARIEGRRPRILVAKVGQDGHDRGAKVIATGFADMGFDVDVGPLFQTPEEVAMQAAENDVHVVGISSLAGGHKTLLPKLVEALKNIGRSDILVVAGGVIPEQDHEFLHQAGAAFVLRARNCAYCSCERHRFTTPSTVAIDQLSLTSKTENAGRILFA